MSSLARWSYTATATVWPLTGRDGRSGAATFGAPAPVSCDYSTKQRRARTSQGREFEVAMTLYTERDDIKPGDRVLLGASVATDPIAAGAREVMAVERSADTFERQADDFEVMV